jgi:hypothetical protein
MTDQTNHDKDPSFEPAKKIEDFLNGLLSFVGNFLLTLFDLAVRKNNISSAVKSGDYKRHTRPVTFISIMSFVGIRIFRFGLLVVLLTYSNISCSRETYIAPSAPSILEELQVPAITEIILYGIPMLIIVTVTAKILSWFLLRSSVEKTARKNLVSVAYYSVGFNYIAFPFLVVLMFIPIIIFGLLERFDFLLIVVPILALLLGSIIFYRLVSNSFSAENLLPGVKGLNQLWLFICTAILMTVATFSAGFIIFNLAQLDLQDYQAQPKLSLGLLGSDNSEGDSFTVDILVSNNTDEVIVIKSTPVNAYGSFKFPGQIITSGLGQNPAYILEPDDVEWLSVLFTETNEEYSRGFISTENIIEFATLNPSGDQENISAYIRADGEVVLISGLE